MKKELMNELERRRIQRQMFALEDEKEAVEARYRFLLEQAQAGVFRISCETGELTEANNETIQMFGCRDFMELKKHLSPREGGESRFFDPMQFRNMERGGAVSFSMHTVNREGEPFWARVILQRLGTPDFLEGIITDISAQVKMDIELRSAIVSTENARKEAEEANKAKSRFLANISHEIRTPLNGIIGFTEIIMASIDSPEGHLYAGKILDESESLMTLINQLLDISKIEARQLQLNNSPFYLRNLLAETISFIRLRARNKGLTLSVDYDENIPSCILSDSYRLRQVLLNLLSNAVKFTSTGGICLKAVLEDQSGDDLVLRFEVHDTGIGIPDEMQKAVFESFVQADSSISRQYGGTGLGITISRELVEIMGGRIWFDSRPGEGSVFYFTIRCRVAVPYHPDEPRGSTQTEFSDRLKGAVVLVVEDYPTNREIAQHHLASAGCIVDMASNGKKALEKAAARKYDLILMDVHMPEMDGLDATAGIRQLEAYWEVPIIGMTANVLPANRQECEAAGMDDFLPKPLRKKDLLETLEYWYTHKDGNPEVFHHGEEPSVRPGPSSPFDYNRFLEDMDGDREAADEIIDGFLDHLQGQTDRLQTAMREGDWELLHREAHSIKGGALNLGAEDLSSWALALEKAAADQLEALIPILFRRLLECIGELRVFREESRS